MKKNPADDATRLKINALDNKSRWFKGPEFLRGEKSGWPVGKWIANKKQRERSELQTRPVYKTSYTNVEYPLTLRLLGWKRLLISASSVRKIFEL
jgi:hypothetical protein